MTLRITEPYELNNNYEAGARLAFVMPDGSQNNYVDIQITPTGDVTIAPSGSDVTITGNLTTTGTLSSTGALSGTLATAAQPNVTSLGTLTTLTVDNINLNGSAITGVSDANTTITPYTGKALVIDGHYSFDANTITSLTDNNSTISAYAGKAVVIDGHYSIDGVAITGLTDANSTIDAYAGKAVVVETVSFDGGVMSLPAAGRILLGADATDGSYQFVRSGNDLLIQRYDTNAWVTKTTISSGL
jgi:hypothetical protein